MEWRRRMPKSVLSRRASKVWRGSVLRRCWHSGKENTSSSPNKTAVAELNKNTALSRFGNA